MDVRVLIFPTRTHFHYDITVTRENPLLKTTLFSVCKIQEGRAESIKSAQQLAMMESRMILVRTLQHPAGTDG